jgi:SAM-dependent methyltransferase
VSAESELRLSFGNAAADYERGRPGWPDAVAAVGGLPREAEVLDLGAGTGKLTRVLARRFARVTAVEPDASMRALLAQVTDCYLTLEGTAEAIPLADASVDAVFCAEAFHWFDWPVALREIARVVRPRGTFVLAWNVPSAETEPAFPDAAQDVARRHRRPGVQAGGSIIESGAWREPFAGAPFEPLRDEAFEHVFVQDRDAVVSETLSVSIYASLPEEERMELARELRAALPDVVYRTRYRSEVTWTRLR